MDLPSPKICRRIRALHALLGSPNNKEAEAARKKLNELLTRHGLSWNDLPAVLAAADSYTTRPAGAPSAPSTAPSLNVLSLVLALIEDHISITPAERMAIGLWALHTYVFDRQFKVTPRLALLSPMRGCGKTNVLILLEALCRRAFRADDPSAASLYNELWHRPGTPFLVDEGDNLQLFKNSGSPLLRLFNSGHRRGGTIARFISGWSKRFSTYAPLAIAAIGELPLPLMHRAILINMQRPRRGHPLEELDETDPAFAAARGEIEKWAASCQLDPTPETPLTLRAGDNWKVLLSIADNLGYGDEARAAAVELTVNRQDEDIRVIALRNIKEIFDREGIDRIASATLVATMHEHDNGFWSEYRGPEDNHQLHKLTQNELAVLLRPFGIRPKPLWPIHRRPGDKGARGYLRSQFRDAWEGYCTEGVTPSQPRKIIGLPRP